VRLPRKSSTARLNRQKIRACRQKHRPYQARISWGVHGLHKVSPGPAMPYHSTPCGRPVLIQPYGRFRGGRPQGGQPPAVLLSPWNLIAIRTSTLPENSLLGCYVCKKFFATQELLQEHIHLGHPEEVLTSDPNLG
jgi:hypothetical protein